ncbi:unnamed protein product, partial [marine sediment metagenome]
GRFQDDQIAVNCKDQCRQKTDLFSKGPGPHGIEQQTIQGTHKRVNELYKGPVNAEDLLQEG